MEQSLRALGGAGRRDALAARANRVQAALSQAIANGESVEKLRDKATTAIKVHEELSRLKGTSEEEQLSILQRCVDMRQSVTWPQAKDKLMAKIAYRAHALYFKKSTGVDIKWDREHIGNPTYSYLGGHAAPRVNPSCHFVGKALPLDKIDLLAYFRAEQMVELEAGFRGGVVFPPGLLAGLYRLSSDDLWQLPESIFRPEAMSPREAAALDGGSLPWPNIPALRKFYVTAGMHACNVLQFEAVRGHLPKELALLSVDYAQPHWGNDSAA